MYGRAKDMDQTPKQWAGHEERLRPFENPGARDRPEGRGK